MGRKENAVVFSLATIASAYAVRRTLRRLRNADDSSTTPGPAPPTRSEGPPRSLQPPGEHPELKPPTPQQVALVERIEASFRDVYLTLISIIQGVAFSFVAERAFATPGPTREQWIAYATCFLVIILVWQEYMVGATVFTWTPTLLDAVIPFGVGIVEFLLIVGARLSTETFLIRFAIFLGIGVVGYINWLFHAIYGGELNKISYDTLHRYVWFGTVACSLFFAASLGLVLAHAADVDGADVIYLSAVLCLTLPLFLHSIVNWSMPLHLIHLAKRGPQSRSQAAAKAKAAAEGARPVGPKGATG